MPIRFRCAYCNQLMGIARRKAGTVVRCPRCAGQVIVPNPEAVAPAPGNGLGPEPPRPTGPGPALFEQGDFEKLFEPAAVAPSAPVAPVAPSAPVKPVVPSAPVAASAPPPAGSFQGFDVEPMAGYTAEALPPVPGVFLTPIKLTLLITAVVILLGLFFVLGLLVGRT
jgi:DNA-directed RNA polymerase subunit RPC12/RpoP